MIFHLSGLAKRTMRKNKLLMVINMENKEYYIDSSDANTRIDKYLSDESEDLSRSFIQKLLTEHLIKVNNKDVKSNYKIKCGDKIDVIIPDMSEPEIEPVDIPLDIIYEDNDVLIVNKPKGMVVHPAPGHYNDTLVNAVMFHCKDNLSGINGVLRPGIVHRIDMNTTGALVVCKDDNAHQSLAQQLSVHSITRKYIAIVYNSFKEDEGIVDAPIVRNPVDRKKMAIDKVHGRRAVTHYKVLEKLGKYTLIECILETGRTHQIRVHMASIGHPLLGDDVYCNAKCEFNLQGQTLHAKTLGFIHPSTNTYMEFEAPLPDYLIHLLDVLRVKSGKI